MDEGARVVYVTHPFSILLGNRRASKANAHWGAQGMDKLFEQILKSVPAEIVPAILALTVAFFGTYYFRGIRTYTDTLNDSVFQTLAVFVIAGFLVWQIQKPSPHPVSTTAHPLLLVPRFENDSGRELETLFVTQPRASVEHYMKDASIEQINTFVRDMETARLNAADVKPLAMLFEPKIIREAGKTPILCFRLLFLASDRVTTFSAVPADLDKMNLSDLSTALLSAAPQTWAIPNDPILSRLDALERKVADLSNALLRISTSPKSATNQPYPSKRAVVLGVNYDNLGQLPKLSFAASDAQAMADVLKRYGFEVTLLTNEHATRSGTLNAIEQAVNRPKENDLLLFFYAGASAKSEDLGAKDTKRLVLPTYDFVMKDPLSNLTLNTIFDRLLAESTLNRLIVIDGCHGTYGLRNLPVSSNSSDEHAFQILASSQDEEFAFELPSTGGGIFTQQVVEQLNMAAESKSVVSIQELFANVMPKVRQLTNGKQLPKLLQLAGSQDVTLVAQ